jgi:anti-anti-sigma regulatory factor
MSTLASPGAAQADTAYPLPAELTIYSAMETRDSLLAWVTEQSTRSRRVLELSASAVTEVDGSGLQLIAALSNMHLPWRLTDASAEFSEACRTLGLTDWLRDVGDGHQGATE